MIDRRIREDWHLGKLAHAIIAVVHAVLVHIVGHHERTALLASAVGRFVGECELPDRANLLRIGTPIQFPKNAVPAEVKLAGSGLTIDQAASIMPYVNSQVDRLVDPLRTDEVSETNRAE